MGIMSLRGMEGDYAPWDVGGTEIGGEGGTVWLDLGRATWEGA